MDANEIDKDMLCELTLRWARYSARMFQRWELAELHSEAFIVAMHLLQRDRYKPEKGSLSTFLWHALPMDVRHRYRNANGERYLTDTDGVRRYKKTEYVTDGVTIQRVIDDKIADETPTGIPMQMLEPKTVQRSVGNHSWESKSRVDQEWLQARIAGMQKVDLARRGMNYTEQRRQAEILHDEQQSKRQTR
tara:strand:- start:368 stop:940 length:573 start_codon:yes stop_codon:yes gene_type:complete